HTNFKISSCGEELFLSSCSGFIIDQTNAVSLEEDETYGRLPDGGSNWVYFSEPTCGCSNNVTNQMLFTFERGYYNHPLYQKIISLLGDTVYYTLDCTVPTVNSSIYEDSIFLDFTYNSPNYFSLIPTSPEQNMISYKAWEPPDSLIDKANILRCASYRNGIRTSKIYTESFFIDSLIFDKYSTPVISLVTESDNLFSYDSGIYVPGVHYDTNNPCWSGNYFQKGDAWERPVHIEYFESNGNIGFSQDAGIRINGGKTRHAAQKSLRLYARNEYGNKNFNYQLLPQKPVSKYKRFLLRNTMSGWQTQAMIKDVLAHEISRDLNIEVQDFQPVIVFINGEYWGIHSIRDRIDEHFIAYTYNLDPDTIEFKENNNQHYQNLVNFIDSNDLSINSNYEYVKTLIDIDNYIDYYIAELFLANYDWPANNVKLWRPKTQDGKWRWVLVDLDAGFGDENINMFVHATLNDTSIFWPNSPSSTFIFRNLLKNSSFQDQLITTYADVLNSIFDVNIMKNKLDIIIEMYKPEISLHSARWNFPDSFSKWESDIEEDLVSFIYNRPCCVEINIIDFFDLNEFGFHCYSAIGNNLGTNSLNLFPNPNNGFFHLRNCTNDIHNASVIIAGVNGEIVFREDNISLASNEVITFNLSHFINGTYILYFKDAGLSVQKKIIIIE
ncbi:MAG: CotH kinase family protein, partial [Bacteroidales bacterium]|nr:CotH kinase family protein [Bacteroidales bacterium]